MSTQEKGFVYLSKLRANATRSTNLQEIGVFSPIPIIKPSELHQFVKNPSNNGHTQGIK